MYQKRLSLLFLLLFFFASSTISSQTITAVSNGKWSSPGTWDLNRVPESTDIVIIDGKDVRLDISSEIASLQLSNSSLSGYTQLLSNGNGVNLTINGDMTVEGVNHTYDVEFDIETKDSIYIAGNLTFIRNNSSASPIRTRLKMIDDGKLTVNGNLTYNNTASSSSEEEFEIQLYNKAQLKINGNLNINHNSGNNFTFYSEGSSKIDIANHVNVNVTGGNNFLFNTIYASNAYVGGNFTLNNNNSSGSTRNASIQLSAGGDLYLEGNLNLASGIASSKAGLIVTDYTSEIHIGKDINFDAKAAGDVSVDLQASGLMYLGGNISRSVPDNFGAFTMDEDTKLYYNGSGAQEISADDVDENGTDDFYFTNIQINNNGGTLTLEGELTVHGELILTKGIIQTSLSTPIILEDQAKISGGSSAAYIDGPIIKKGRTNGAPFTFPLGNNGIYAPIEIEAVSNASTQYTAQFMGCPPPIGIFNTPLTRVSEVGFWSLNRGDGAAVGNITLHWDDAVQNGITDVDSLTVAYHNTSSGWHSLGNSNPVVSGASGNISNDLGCPPPIGANLFTFGATSQEANPLPVELGIFKAYKDQDNSKVYLEWETLSEENTDYFVVEKSYDGISFEMITNLDAAFSSTITQYYKAIDHNPQKGNNYYRIKLIDVDQRMSFSSLVNVFIKINDDAPVVYPNPVKDHLHIYSKDLKDNEEIFILISDLKGNSIYGRKHRIQDKQIIIPTAILNMNIPGTYFISYLYQGKAYSLEVLKATY